MAEMLWRKRCTSRFDRMTVSFEDGHYVATREGHAERYEFEKYGKVENWVRQFYDGLLYSSEAPDDLFLDALKSATKSHHGTPRRV